jgi:hypothetical protein
LGFLESGSGIVDAILTQKGREALAKNDGSFRITKYAFGDDEINYQLYDATKSVNQDADILNTPVLEPISNAAVAQLYTLISLPKGTQKIATLSVKPTSATVAYGDDALFTVQTLNGEDSQGYKASIRDSDIGVLSNTKVSLDQDGVARFTVKTGANAGGKSGVTIVDITGVNSGARKEFTLTISASGTTT